MSTSTETPGPERRETLREAVAMFEYLRPYKARFLTAVVALAISMGFGLMFPYLVGHLLDAAVPSLRVSKPGAWTPDVNTVAAVLVGTLAIQAMLTFFYSYSFNKVGEQSVVGLRRNLYSRIIALPMSFFGEHRVGELSSRLSSDLAQMQETFTATIPQALRQITLLTGGIIFIAITSWKLSIVMISTFPVLVLLAVLFGRKIRKLSRGAQDRLAESATVVEETLQGIANVKAFGNEAFEMKRYASRLDAFLHVILQTARFRAALISFIIFGIFGSIILVLWYGARLMQAGQLTHGELTRFILYTTFVGGSVASFAEVFSQIQKTLGATQRVRELLREPPEIAVSGNPPQTVSIKGEVRFEQVHFRYPSRSDMPVLRALSLHAQPGEKIALVGPSGAGKSTIVSLLLRFYEPNAGQILIDGKNAAEYDLAALRANMALVPQEVLLFGSSIRDNIGYGRPGASDEEILQASQRANCSEFVERFPEGYNTLVGERGVKLSGGQRQRIAIARALLKDPAILILDEATSSLDSESEQLIQQALATLLEGRTAFIIAHRLSTVRQCDRIYVIEDGAAAESGTHGELIERQGGTYRRLSELQFAT